MPDSKPSRCACGRTTALYESGFDEGWRVQCSLWSCWSGPWRKTKRGAVAVWNRRMGGSVITSRWWRRIERRARLRPAYWIEAVRLWWYKRTGWYTGGKR